MSLTLIIEGQDPWRRPTTEEEARKMARWSAKVDALDVNNARCSSCALRAGTVPSRSSLVAQLIESCALSGGTFCCHMAESPTQECAGFRLLRGAP
jgi:hypothetical protein